MANQILVPALGESVTEATVSKWLKQVGEKVETDEPLVELETDKVNIEVPSPLSGILSSIKVKEGDSAVVGTLLGIVNEASSNNNKKLSKNEKVSPLKKKSSQKVTDNKKDIKTINVKTEAENSNGTLVLDTLASASAEAKKTEVIESNNEEATDSVSKVVEKKYIPPKTKKH